MAKRKRSQDAQDIVEETPALPVEKKAPDVGQPVGHIISNLVDCDRLVADV